ncbi:MAG: alpha/beta hydrolase [Ktedonobacterales bacterium]
MRISNQTQQIVQRRLRQTATIGAAVTGSALLGTLGLSYYVAHLLTAPRRKRGPTDDFVMTPFETGADFEEISFPSLTGEYRLSGWWLTRPETDQVVIGCHGYRGSKSELIGIATIFWRAGFNVMLFDFHGHGAAVGSNVTLGYREVQDLCAAIDYAEECIPSARIGIFGFSMGASVAIMGSIKRQEVRCVLADSPFARHRDVVAHNVSRVTHLSGKTIALLADQFLPHLGGYRSRDVEPVRDVALLAPRPLFVIHGTADSTIPVEQAVQIYRMARQPKELWLAEGAPHCGAYFQDRSLYCERAVSFFARYLSAGESEDSGGIQPLRDQEPA